MYEDNLLVPHDWPRDLKEELEEDADKWRATAGLTPNDISWGDTIRAGRIPQQTAERLRDESGVGG